MTEKSENPNKSKKIISIENVSTQLGGQWVNKDFNLTINHGEIIAIVGGSGSGKSTILREMLALQNPTSGVIKIYDKALSDYSMTEMEHLRHRCGVLFQQGALFSGLTLLENVAYPFYEFPDLTQKEIDEIALFKIILVGLPADAAVKFPFELSGGMLKRAGLARAIVLDPEILFLDEPTSGLDPISASAFDDLLLQLHKAFGMTVVMVTHDLDTIAKVPDRIVFLGEGKVLALGTYEELRNNKEKLVHEYFHNDRARALTVSKKEKNSDKRTED